jgi:protein-tyrosine-phosphatase
MIAMEARRMSRQSYSVLFVGTGNSGRSIMAEAILRLRGLGRFTACSAGTRPTGQIDADTLAQLQQARLPVEGLRSKSWDEFARPDAPPVDFVFYVCDAAAREAAPDWPGEPVVAKWIMPDPVAVTGPELARKKAFHDAFMQLDWRIGLLIALPMSGLDQLSLERHMKEIGTS